MREFLPHDLHDLPESAPDAFDQILADEKNWLNATDIPRQVFKDRVAIFKIVGQSLLDHLVVAVIFAPPLKCPSPGVQFSDSRQVQDFDRSLSKRNDNVIVHFGL